MNKLIAVSGDSQRPKGKTMSQSSPASSGGVGFGGLLTILFVGLKLGGVIAWPWVWVLCPIWIPFAIFAAIFLVVAVAFVIRFKS